MKIVTSLLFLVLAVSLAACGSSAPPAPQTIQLVVTDPPAPPAEVKIPLGAEVTIVITTPKDDEAHLHGYEVELDVPAGVPTDLTFTANMSGSYELESHITEAVWLNLVVS
ncbi:MAG: cupredoxin domain-containing protein [Tessaracoccus sp.]|uniref:cupredoxin domain-containing protein n=1 Tax=Tessaracoccus sp. TaxID=1971211 RepID=UPI001ECD04F6|nr:cupredoxin domain-containing protein [Tessaracoccus sp.]MBK7820373.1 cupredoxin domain-containing protein [Tessaracoccus sp.]